MFNDKTPNSKGDSMEELEYKRNINTVVRNRYSGECSNGRDLTTPSDFDRKVENIYTILEVNENASSQNDSQLRKNK